MVFLCVAFDTVTVHSLCNTTCDVPVMLVHCFVCRLLSVNIPCETLRYRYWQMFTVALCHQWHAVLHVVFLFRPNILQLICMLLVVSYTVCSVAICQFESSMPIWFESDGPFRKFWIGCTSVLFLSVWRDSQYNVVSVLEREG